MLTESQKEYLEKIPEDAEANIRAWDPEIFKFAENLVKQLENVGLEIFWEGSLALKIPGQNDIDLYLFSEPEDFDKYLPRLVLILGEPTWKLDNKILWRTKKNDCKIDASLASKSLEDVQKDMLFFNSLKSNKELLQEYVSLKEGVLSAREYFKRKNEFYNRVIGLK